MDSDLVLVIVVVTALAFDFTNGFHDTANVVATGISTRAIPPRTAVLGAALLNFVGAFISLEVAATVANGIVEADLITPTIVFAGLIGAITWNLITWWYGLPSSSSHALIGGVVGAALAAEGTKALVSGGLLGKVIVPALIAPVLAFAVAGLGILCAYWIIGRLRPGSVNRGFRHGQIVTGGLLALSHGTNDAQKTMGIILLALIANGNLSEGSDPPMWVVIARRDRNRARHVRGRLAHHPHAGDPHHQDGPGPGLCGAGRGRDRDPRLVALRLPAVDHPHDLRRDHRRGRGEAAVGRALGRGRQHRHRLGPHAPGGRHDGRDRLRGDPHLRHRRARARDRLRARDRPDRGDLRAALASRDAATAPRRGRVRAVIATVVDWAALRDVVVASLAAGVGVTVTFSLAILGLTRFADMRRDERVVGAWAYAGLAILGLAVSGAAVVFGIILMTSK